MYRGPHHLSSTGYTVVDKLSRVSEFVDVVKHRKSNVGFSPGVC